MARGNLKGPLGPVMLALLIGVALFMVVAVNTPDQAAQFSRPDGFYDNMFGKIGTALLFAAGVSIVVFIVRKLFGK
ncbi:hypothetical protein [Croceicoccus sp. Ery15]|uniref:hypothetical protein n=1 Tax=Croceicoccus sp. Ery15 TaxID=1703338 RepID=UPI001E499577|nr:hypothetical protein [Croceicoccus sp. Ery15]